MCLVEEYFSDLGEVQLVDGRELSAQQLSAADVLLVRSVTRVNASLLQDKQLQFVGSATSGIDHIDRDELARRGIPFAYAPGSNAESVIQYVLSAVAGCGDKLEQLLGGGRVGIIGYGVIGKALHRRLQALGIECLAYDPWLDSAEFTALTTLERVLDCDVVSVHAELTRRDPFPSYHLLDAGKLGLLPSGGLLVSAGRGPVVDNRALLELCRQGCGFEIVLDVWENEPEVDRELMQYCLFATPHIAGYSYDGKVLATGMLHAALCQALALPAAAASPRLDAGPILSVDYAGESGDDAGFIRWLLARAYDIADDDRALREQLDSLGFDGLRRNYPKRRELGSFLLPDSTAMTQRQQQLCIALGCKREPARC
jgi:erythronate-4-phosphate dehydrogenase